MDIDKIRELVHAAPFVPFDIHRASGRVSRVEHPDFIALLPLGKNVVVFRLDGGREKHETIAVSHIVAVHQDVAA